MTVAEGQFGVGRLFDLSKFREKLNLSNPGTWEALHRESKSVQTTNYQFDGAKFDLTSILTPNFQVLHSIAWGSPSFPPTYQFGAVFADGQTTLHGQVDHEGSLQARAHYNWKAGQPQQSQQSAEGQPPQMPDPSRLSSTTKLTTHLMTTSGHNMMQLEHDHQGADYTVNVKAVNPNPIDSAPSWAPATKKNDASLTGIYQISYLQAVSRSLAVGGELVYQRPMPDVEEPGLTFAMRYAPPPSELPQPTTVPAGMQSPFPPVHPKDPTQVFTATLAPSSGLLHASYWRRLNQRLEVSAEAQLLASKASHMGEGRREGIATVAFKLDTISSTIRGQIDTQGRLGAVLEERIAPGISLQLAGEIDYAKGGGGQGRVGCGFTLEM
ncbi:translocase of outer mitochondrial membrane [Borealophlyctis nickersoniae]|nr:translocase of outer mitochondrial membrane [Borealophlyctis nickersoniae]